MAVKAEFKVKGLEELQRRLNKRSEQLKKVLDMKILQLAEEAVTHAKWNKGYKDRTANLKNSISFALFFNGELVTSQIGEMAKPEEAPKDQQDIGSILDDYSQQNGVVAPSGYSLIVVAGMNYGAHVEHKGYNVLHLTKYFLRDEMRKILEEAIEDIKEGRV